MEGPTGSRPGWWLAGEPGTQESVGKKPSTGGKGFSSNVFRERGRSSIDNEVACTDCMGNWQFTLRERRLTCRCAPCIEALIQVDRRGRSGGKASQGRVSCGGPGGQVGDFVEAIPIHLPRLKPPLGNVCRALSSQGFVAQVERNLACLYLSHWTDQSRSINAGFLSAHLWFDRKPFPPRGSVILFIFLVSSPIGASNTLRDLWKTGSGLDFLGLTDGRPMVLNAGIGTD